MILATGVAATAAAVAGSSLAAGGPRATLAANAHVAGLSAIPYGSSITLSGKETLRGSRSYAVQAQAWPFTAGFTTIASGKTTGTYSFVVRPSHATRYRLVIANGPTSPVLTVYVLDKKLSLTCNLCNRNNTSGTHTLIITGRFQRPPGLTGHEGPAYFYYALNPSSSTPTIVNRVATVPRQFVGGSFSFTVTYTVHFPKTTFRFGEDVCWKDQEPASGVGLPGHHGCGNAKINRFRYAG